MYSHPAEMGAAGLVSGTVQNEPLTLNNYSVAEAVYGRKMSLLMFTWC